MQISLILATYGRVDELGRLIDSLLAQTVRAGFELLVMDQNQDDRVGPFVARAQRGGIEVRHVRLAKPGLSAARNAGLALATGDVVGFPDDDCWYDADAVEQIGNAFATQPGWVGVVIDWVEPRGSASPPPPGRLLQLQEWARFRGGDASSISIFLRRDAVVSVGGFDPRLGVGQWFSAGEETDLILSLLRRGDRIARWPAAHVHHPYAGSSARLTWRAALQRARGTGALYVKHALPISTVARGLLAPLLQACWPWRGKDHALRQLAVGLGRSQGAMAWWWFARRKS